MRVTENTNFGAVRESIRRSKERMENLQYQNATLKKLNTPSDDPVGAAKVLEVRTDKVNNDQFVSNGKLAEAFLNNTDHALSQLVDVVNRAKEIAIGQSSAASSTNESRLGVAEEITQLFNQAVAIANTRIGDRYLFGGYKTQTPPVDPNGRYVGDEGQMMVEISKGVYLAMNVPGVEAFNTQPSRIQQQMPGEADSNSPESVPNGGGSRKPASFGLNGNSHTQASDRDTLSDQSGPENVNVFDEIQDLRIGLLTGDLDTIRNTLDRFDQIHGQLVATRAKIGSRLQGLESTGQAMERHNITNAQLTSALEDADMAKVVSDLAKEETVFRSALASSQKLIQPTLMEFLK
jgi:flagellar hook-associated protein 3 FlgL